MFAMKGQVEQRWQRVQNAADKAQFRNLRHAGFSISKRAKASIETSDFPSEAGQPPHTKRRARKNIRGAIFVDANKESAVIGPRQSWVGTVGEAHELGRSFHGQQFEERPFMGPALDESVDRFAQDWAGSIGE